MKLRKTVGFIIAMLPFLAQAESADNGLLTVPSQYSAVETVQLIEKTVTDKGMTVFALIDHQKAEQDNGLNMPAATVVVFGSPKVGTAMMVERPTLAIDLPLKALVWEDQNGKVFVSLNKAEFLGKRHHVPQALSEKLSGAEKLIANTVKEQSAR
ncbi:Uncharacterized conserved protein, DUF302 family [Pasteurella testudinis DSM 23072]|uniref:Uncharacterized conserved protein, DUF302 family n=1 Tax=Pasteurella testudinis DSM 23072 TaxID=1122938 RepID=A0A1W1UVI7_9PAST|nr:DUF302 domain-containing protein [Pasteurella testudinis]SMB84999.1 Uncharacterized conserved protein, DUF302 family [Pasteurella testudinis DSM 23072]SUB52898.1 camphor resistance protein CrcB [Pasteurella testudinis]